MFTFEGLNLQNYYSFPKVAFYLADQNPHRDRSLGISRYTLSLGNALLKSRRIQLTALGSRSSVVLDSPAQSRLLPFRTDRSISRLLADHFHRPFLPNAAVYHYPKGFLPMGIPAKPPAISTIHDTILCYYLAKYPTHRSPSAYRYWFAQLRHAVKNSDHIITVSEFSRQAIIAFAEQNKICPPSISVTYQGAYGEEHAGTIHEKEDYVMSIASGLPHKQTHRLLEWWKRFSDRHHSAPRLRLIGQLTTELQVAAAQCHNIEIRTASSAEELFQNMQKAISLIYPSEIEGFGLPALEAIYAGTPVVFVSNTAVEEILDFPIIGGFRLDDFESFESAVLETLNLTQVTVSELALRLKARYQWSSVANRTIDAYHSVL